MWQCHAAETRGDERHASQPDIARDRKERAALAGMAAIHDDRQVTTTHAAANDEASLRYPGWRVVLACYLAAVFCWGFGLYGHGVYLTELQRLHGWPTSLISAAVTGFYLLTAALVVFISDAIARLGPKRVMLIGACCFGSAVALLGVIDALWQLYLAYMLMAVGAATMHVGAISNVVGLWFDRKRALALSLALNGASSGGILITPALVLAIAHFGFSNAILGADAGDGGDPAAGHRAVDRPAGRTQRGLDGAGSRRPGPGASALRSRELLERGRAVRDGADRAGRLPGASDRDPRTGHRPGAGRFLGRGADHRGDHRALRAWRLRATVSTCAASRRGRWRARPWRCWR